MSNFPPDYIVISQSLNSGLVKAVLKVLGAVNILYIMDRVYVRTCIQTCIRAESVVNLKWFTKVKKVKSCYFEPSSSSSSFACMRAC